MTNSNQRLITIFRFLLLGAIAFRSNAFVVSNRGQVSSVHPQIWSSANLVRPTTSSSLAMASAVAQGMELFRQGDVLGSIAKFDASVPPGSNAYLWQRGISYYYAGEFAKGSQQFRDDVLRSPLDVEEIVWDIACLLRMENSKFPVPTMMSLPPGKMDRRPIMVNTKIDRCETT
jgi:hypothetical protein